MKKLYLVLFIVNSVSALKQGRCKGDIFFAPKDGEIRCAGAGASTDIKEGMSCKVVCTSAIATPEVINCTPGGWDAESATCDASARGLTPGAQMVLILVGLGALSGGTFFYQKWKKGQEDDKPQMPVVAGGNQPEKDFDLSKVAGYGRDGCDNLQTCALNEHSPLPQPKTRPANGYHPAGKGIHDFMGTCTIGTISQHPNYKD